MGCRMALPKILLLTGLAMQADAGDALLKESGSVAGAARALWEERGRRGLPMVFLVEWRSPGSWPAWFSKNGTSIAARQPETFPDPALVTMEISPQ